ARWGRRRSGQPTRKQDGRPARRGSPLGSCVGLGVGSVDRAADLLVDGAGGGDDQVAVEEADRGLAAVLGPDVGADGLDDQVDQLFGLGALVLGLAGAAAAAARAEDR